MDERIRLLATIIMEYRKNELGFVIDENHVLKWLNQFSEETRDIVLEEIIHIFEKWYFHKKDYLVFFDVIMTYLSRKYSCPEQDIIKNIIVVNEQDDGLSQHKLVSWFSEEIEERYGAKLKTEIKEGKNFIYVDDGLYTGKRARKDLISLIDILPTGSSLDVFYMVASMKSLKYVETQIKPIARGRNIEIELFRMHPIDNDKAVDSWYERDGTYVEAFSPEYMCLWPSSSLSSNPEIVSYEHELRALDKCERRLYRDSKWVNDKGIFSSVETRDIVEREFLLKGIQIVKSCEVKPGIHPLGFNLWPSFGFGSITASDINISNTCPLVLWWGNNIQQGDVLDAWYPLLPRRVNSHETLEETIEEWISFEPEYDRRDQYNMCPDCGKFFGKKDDGGNGFCIDCAWKH